MFYGLHFIVMLLGYINFCVDINFLLFVLFILPNKTMFWYWLCINL